MARGLLRKGRATGSIVPEAHDPTTRSLEIEVDEREGVLRIFDPRAFREGRRGFCRRLLEAAGQHPGFAKAEVDIHAASCRLEFDPRTVTAASMAEAVTSAVRRASATGRAAEGFLPWRRASRWSTLTAYRTPEGVSWWETIASRPGRVDLRHAASPGDDVPLADLSAALAGVDGIEASHVSAWSRTLSLDYRPDSTIADRLLDVVERTSRDMRSGRSPHDSPADGDRGVSTGLGRLRHLAMAGGSFAMTVVGLVVPGIPTVPFLLATSYYLARSSPGLNDRLRRTALFGPILSDWEQHRGLSRWSKARLVGLTVVIVAITATLSVASPVVLIVVLVISLGSIYGIVRLPGLPDDETSAIAAARPSPLALPAP